MARPILLNPRGGPVRVVGQIIEPGFAPLKIDVWRHVRHPPPDVVHAYSVKTLLDDEPGYYLAGPPSALLGKVISWIWVCDRRQGQGHHFKVRIDVQQDGESVPGYPAEYAGALPPGQPWAHLKVSEVVELRGRRVAG